jgi:hypothetical protein
MDFCIIFKSVCGSTVTTVTRIYNGRYGVQILTEAKELSILQYIQNSSSTHTVSPKPTPLNENHSFFTGGKVAIADSLTTHIHLEPSLKISGAITPQQPSAPWHILV